VIEVHALVDPFPAVVGWHPWFHRRLGAGQPLRYELDATARLVRGADHLPTGEVREFDPSDGPFDDAFMVPGGTARVWWPGALALDIASDAGWYVVFDELRNVACIEPQSGPPDGLRDGLGRSAAVAAPGLPHRLVTTWTMRDL
jgi:aldose 1-epimerase